MKPPALLGRERELEAIQAAIDDVAAGRGGVVLIEGPAGIGKTSLLAAGQRLAADGGLRVLAARGGELEREFDFGVVRQLLERHAAQVGPASLAGPARLAAPVLGLQPQGAAPAPVDTRFAVLHGLHWLVADLAGERPLLIVIDDAHWADAPSLRFLSYMAGRVEGLPLLLAVATRSADEPELAALGTDPQTLVLRPPPLDCATVGSLVEGPADTEFVAAVHHATGGNPLLVRELLAQLRADGVAPAAAAAAAVAATGPRAIVRRLLLRLAGLPAGSLPLARALAVLGDRAHQGDACALAELDPAGLVATVDALVAAGLLAAGTGLEFAHPVIRRAVYDDISPSLRGDLHARAARLLAERGAASGEVAAHLLVTPPRGDAWALEALCIAAAEAAARGAPEIAANYLRRGLAEPPPRERAGELLAELGTVEALAQDGAAVEHLRAALVRLDDPLRRAQVALELGRLASFAGDLDEAHRGLACAIEELGDHDRELGLQLQAQLTMTDNIRSVRARPEIDPDTLAGRTTGERQLLASLAFSLAMEPRPVERALRVAERALADGELVADPGGSPRFMDAVATLCCCDSYEPALTAVERAVADARRRGNVGSYAGALAMRTSVYYRLGRLGDAASDATEALRLAAGHRMGWLVVLTLSFLVDALIDRDELDAAEDALAIHGADGALPSHLGAHAALAARGRLHAARGRLDEALADMREAGRRLEATGVDSPVFLPWRSHTAHVLVRLERFDEAIVLAEQELAAARVVGTPWAIGVTLRAAGLSARGETGMALLEEAVEVLGRSPCRLEHARATIDLGAELRRSGRPGDARELLYQGLDRAHRCGAYALEARATQLLLQTGARPRRAALHGVDALTPSERRIVEMAASEMTNREIAQALFVTVKTVEMHLGHAYPKLGVRGRAELEAALAGGEREPLAPIR